MSNFYGITPPAPTANPLAQLYALSEQVPNLIVQNQLLAASEIEREAGHYISTSKTKACASGPPTD